MIRRILSLVLLVWVLGFAAFVVWLPGPVEGRDTDGIIVLTGGENRINRGLELMGEEKAQRMLVAGVNRSVRPQELAEQNDAPVELFECCIDLDRDSVDTRSNGAEAARWVHQNDFESVRLITTDWHMPRARFELDQHIDPQVSILNDAVASNPKFGQLFVEYHKYILRRIGAPIGL